MNLENSTSKLKKLEESVPKVEISLDAAEIDGMEELGRKLNERIVEIDADILAQRHMATSSILPEYETAKILMHKSHMNDDTEMSPEDEREYSSMCLSIAQLKHANQALSKELKEITFKRDYLKELISTNFESLEFRKRRFINEKESEKAKLDAELRLVRNAMSQKADEYRQETEKLKYQIIPLQEKELQDLLSRRNQLVVSLSDKERHNRILKDEWEMKRNQVALLTEEKYLLALKLEEKRTMVLQEEERARLALQERARLWNELTRILGLDQDADENVLRLISIFQFRNCHIQQINMLFSQFKLANFAEILLFDDLLGEKQQLEIRSPKTMLYTRYMVR